MTFLNPMILYAAFAAMVPLVLHLMARNQTVRMPFSTIRFLKLAQKQSSTKVRMENFLLWLVRTLLMLLLSLAFAKPVLRLSGTTSWSAMLGTSRRDVAIIWDASYSMGYETGRKSVWEASKETVESIIRGLSKGDRVSVFLAADTVIPIVGEATSDLDFAINTVKGQAIRTTTSNLSDTTVAALEALKDTNHEREFFIVTDGQSLAWNGFRQANAQGQAAAEPAKAGAPAKTEATAAKPPTAWNPDKIDKKSTTFFVALLGAKEPANTAPLRVEIQPPLIMTDTAPKMRVTLGHTGVAQQTSVTLFVDDREISRRAVDLEADTGGEAEFVLPELSAGNHKARIETGDDGLSIDNTYYLLIKVREDLPILIVGNAEDTFFLERALAPTDKASLKTKRTTADALAGETLDGYPVIFLCNALPIAGPALSNLEEYARRGGVLALFPGDKANTADYASWASLPAKVQKIVSTEETPKREGLVLLDPLDPLFAGLRLPPGVAPSATIQRRLAFGKPESESKSLIGASAETPFLLSRQFGEGRVLLFAVSADRQWSDLPLSPFFLPLVQQTVRFAAGIGRDKIQVMPASSFLLSDVISKVPDGASLLGPDGETLLIRRVQRQGGRQDDVALYVDNVIKPGYYGLAQQGSQSAEPLMAVNVDRSESNLKPVKPDEIPAILGLKNVTVATERQELERQIQEHRVGRPMSEVAMWLILVLAVVEVFMANRASRKRTTLSDTLHVNASGRVASIHTEAV